MSSHITHKDPSKKPCGCDPTIKPSRLDQLIAEYKQLIQETTALKNELIGKIRSLEDVATETQATVNKQEVRSAVDAAKAAIQGNDTTATLTTTQAAVVDGNDTAISVAKEIRSEVGTGSDTAAESGTLFAILKWVKDKVKSIFNLIGSPATGQPSTLFAAIAAGGGGGSAAVPEISVADTGSAATQELAANTLYIFPNRTSDLTLTLGTPVTGEASEYHFIVEVGSPLPTITLPAGLTWKISDTIAFYTDTTYEVSILDNYAIFVVW